PEPDALGLAAHDQGDVRAADGLAVSVPGLTSRSLRPLRLFRSSTAKGAKHAKKEDDDEPSPVLPALPTSARAAGVPYRSAARLVPGGVQALRRGVLRAPRPQARDALPLARRVREAGAGALRRVLAPARALLHGRRDREARRALRRRRLGQLPARAPGAQS